MASSSTALTQVDDLLGRSVSSAGDVNGDGFDDLIIGADGQRHENDRLSV